jgi:hypothetical protein
MPRQDIAHAMLPPWTIAQAKHSRVAAGGGDARSGLDCGAYMKCQYLRKEVHTNNNAEDRCICRRIHDTESARA